jgi:type IV pilus assembly protein PilA
MTLIELLVVVLIMAVIMSIALPLYMAAVADSQRKTCRSNMHTIANAVKAAAVKDMSNGYGSYMGAVSTLTEPDLGAVPLCPNAGTYTIISGNTGDSTTFAVQCSIAAHGTFQPGVDNN